ncbi:MAG: TonB-dependent receptor [Acidobacteria bacterium]|nr:TonB-dependent receptor [Acidobacteriota bacterium]
MKQPRAAIAGIVFAASVGAAAALSSSALRGTVRADDGTPLPGVIVTLTCGPAAAPQTPVRLLTDVHGAFTFNGLEAERPCTLRADLPGYAAIDIGPIALRSGKTTDLPVRLTPSDELTTRVVVEATPRTVDTETAVTSTRFNDEYIEGLPLVGRNFQDLLTLAPGITDTDGDGNPNVHGARDTGLQYRLDGADITDPLTGHFGQVLNLDAIKEVELITSGASAEYGRADGGFANIITKSGTNEFEASARFFFRSIYFDSRGAAANDTFQAATPTTLSFRDLKGAFTFGGPVARDRLWYFASVQSIDIQTPVSLGGAGTFVRTIRGYQGLAKLTWQISSDNKISIEGNFDPQRYGGLGLRPGVLAESDYIFRTGGLTSTLRWTTILSPVLLMETTLSHFDTGQGYDPVSSRFAPVHVDVRADAGGEQFFALYPCNVVNCFRSIAPTNLYQIDRYNNEVSGPYYQKDGDRRIRNSFGSTFNLNLDDAWGSHSVRAGFEYTDEAYDDRLITNPVLSSSLRPSHGPILSPVDNPIAVSGIQLLTSFDPLISYPHATGGGLAAFVQENWKPASNLTLGFGLRLDQEIVDTFGRQPFRLRAEAREALRRFDLACSIVGVLCEINRTPGKPSSGLPTRIAAPPDSPLARFDTNEDGWFDTGRGGEGDAIWGLYTRPELRPGENFTIANRNLAPRLSFAWDPWNDGRTKVSGTMGRYFDRLFLGEVTVEQLPDVRNFVFVPGPDVTPWINPGDRSLPTLTRSIFEVNRGLTTPYTDERTFTVEREIAPEWSIAVTSIQRTAKNLLQDFDVNHITCPDYRKVFHVDTYTICGENGRLVMDLFGGFPDRPPRNDLPIDPVPLVGPLSLPNGAPDLYNVNPYFDQVFRVGNYNASRYRALELVLNRRLHHNWQMQLSYSLSRATGDAEQFLSVLGDDPAYRDKQRGPLDYDQRHIVKAFASTHLPKRVILGGSIFWASGTPFSAIYETIDIDDVGNSAPRFSYVNGRRNDQRNGDQWTVNGRVEKGFAISGKSAEAYFAVDNLLGQDDVTLYESRASAGALGLRSFNRRFGRRWEMGMSIHI